MFRLEVTYMFLADGVINYCNILPWTITIVPSVQSLGIQELPSRKYVQCNAEPPWSFAVRFLNQVLYI